MIQRSLQASVEGIKAAKIALIDRFSNNQQRLADALEISRQPVNKFFNGKPVDSSLFVQICEKLGLKWQKVADTDFLQSEVEESLQNANSTILVQEIYDNVKPNTKQGFEIIRVLDMTQPITELELPEGQVSLESPFYVERPPIESDCYKEIVKPGALIRVKAPRQMGKTSLMARILQHGTTQGYKEVPIYFEQADREVFANLDQFLQWFCASVAWELNIPERLVDYWKGVLGSKNKCTNYFQRYLLAEINSPLVLGLDEVDLIFQYQRSPLIFLDCCDLGMSVRRMMQSGKNYDW